MLQSSTAASARRLSGDGLGFEAERATGVVNEDVLAIPYIAGEYLSKEDD